jgi:hypothetical protein
MKIYMTIITGFILTLAAFAAPEIKLESLGNPITGKGIKFFASTENTSNEQILWATVSSANRFGLLKTNSVTGKTQWFSLKKYGPPKVIGQLGPDKNIYILCGKPVTRFLKFNPQSQKWTDMGIPAKRCFYFLNSLMTFDGKFIVGTYPDAQLVWLDTKTGKTGASGHLDNNIRNKYITRLKQAKSGIIYSASGLNKKSVWSYNLKNGKKKQILTPELSAQNGSINLYVGKDENVYGRDLQKKIIFLCQPDGIKLVKRFSAKKAPRLQIGNFEVIELASNGNLVLLDRKTKKHKLIKTDFKPDAPLIYSICGGLNGKIWLGGFQPANITSINPAKKDIVNFGRKTRGGTQVYSMIETPEGLFAASYTTGSINLVDVDDPSRKSKLLISLDSKYKQERIFSLIPGKDGMIYGPTMPVKGILGGGIVRVNPKTLKCKFFRNIIFEQSIRSIALTSDGLILGCSNTDGGTSAIPTQKEAVIFLWNPSTGKVVWQGKPGKGETNYSRVCSLGDDLFCIISARKKKCIFFDAKKREVISIVNIPRKKGLNGLRLAGAAPEKLGKKAYILSGDRLLEIDVTGKIKVLLNDNKVIYKKFHKALHGTHAEWVSPDGFLYLGSESSLWEMDLSGK